MCITLQGVEDALQRLNSGFYRHPVTQGPWGRPHWGLRTAARPAAGWAVPGRSLPIAAHQRCHERVSAPSRQIPRFLTALWERSHRASTEQGIGTEQRLEGWIREQIMHRNCAIPGRRSLPEQGGCVARLWPRRRRLPAPLLPRSIPSQGGQKPPPCRSALESGTESHRIANRWTHRGQWRDPPSERGCLRV